jgi:mitogen-activated protein kinase kinase kinase 3
LHIFLEYVAGGSLQSLIKKYGYLNERLIQIYTRQILEGLEYLHMNKIVHRDIKGANVLVDINGTCKLADFGNSKRLYSTRDDNLVKGTAHWMAPEVIKQQKYGRYSDIWSLGCTIIEMATGHPPWSEYKSPASAMFHIAQTKEGPTVPSWLSQSAKEFLSLCF